METMVIVAVAALNKYTAVTQTFSVHLSSHIVQMYSCKIFGKMIVNLHDIYLAY